MHADTLLSHLRNAATSHAHPVPLFTTAADADQGLCFYLEPRRIYGSTPQWFLQLPQIRESGFRRRDGGIPHLMVNWQRLLAQAAFPAKPLSALAHHLLDFLRPVVWQYDAVLHTDIDVFRRRYATLKGQEWLYPMDLGQRTSMEEERFNAHLAAILKLPGFIRDVRRTMEASWAPLVNDPCRRNAIKAYGETSEIAGASYLRVNAIGSTRGVSTKIVHSNVHSAFINKPWMWVTRYILDGFSGNDGCWRLHAGGASGHAVLVNWAIICETAADQGWGEPFDAIIDPGNHKALEWGYKARMGFAAFTKDRFLSHRPQTLYELAAPTGYVVPPILEHGWELYKVKAMVDALQGYCHRATTARTLAAQRGVATVRDAVRYKVVESVYNGVPVYIRRRLDQTWFTVPYPLDAAWDVRQLWEGKRHTVHGQVFWSIKGINAHANGYSSPTLMAEPQPMAEDFRDWAEAKAMELSGSAFKSALREQSYVERVNAKHTGKRKHMGPFTEIEDNALREFFEAMSPGILSEDQKKDLTYNVVPGRSILAVIRRREILGKQFAQKHGYKAYLNSGYCGANSSKRRKQWLSEGVPL